MEGLRLLIIAVPASLIISVIIVVKNRALKSEKLKLAYAGSFFAIAASVIIIIATVIILRTFMDVAMAVLAIFWLPLLENHLASIALFFLGVLMVLASLPLFLASTIIYFVASNKIKEQYQSNNQHTNLDQPTTKEQT